ncbi:unnamed protein product [Acanthoscelides obtectus]|uniref:Uncharacterized protein n=1 Tax=Acanthoscelides obtectus TaxID=200917 RepID=A0A9P0JHF4_ACAOB|nr:unnamed protein product [Acanthoscelides obtectus]CAK1639731.1 hypothetical protein AOBTE_LOCUS11337 [Acanthoscelides obtectus]
MFVFENFYLALLLPIAVFAQIVLGWDTCDFTTKCRKYKDDCDEMGKQLGKDNSVDAILMIPKCINNKCVCSPRMMKETKEPVWKDMYPKLDKKVHNMHIHATKRNKTFK